MSNVIPFHAAADFRAALKHARRLWEDGDVVILSHAQERMLERGIDMLDLQNVIHTGRVTQQLMDRFTIVGQTVDGKSAGCVVKIANELKIITVTPARKKTRRRQIK